MPCLRTLGEAQANDDKRRQYLHQPGSLDLLSCCDYTPGRVLCFLPKRSKLHVLFERFWKQC